MTIDELVLIGADQVWGAFLERKFRGFFTKDLRHFDIEETTAYAQGGIDKEKRRFYLIDFDQSTASGLDSLWEDLARLREYDGNAVFVLLSPFGNGPHSLPEGVHYFNKEDINASIVKIRKKYFN